jgi:ATP-binding cassette subfamily B protein
LVIGAQEIKLTNSDAQKRSEWEKIQAQVFEINTQVLKLSQRQQAGALLFNQSTNLIITAVAANAVISGSLTFGMMLSIQYIIGQLRSPIDQMLQFIQAQQDARISMERLEEISQLKNEEFGTTIDTLPLSRIGIKCFDLAFRYGENHESLVLQGLNLHIPYGKVTALVGPSGSVKTTLVKLLLGLYEPSQGSILIDETDLRTVKKRQWRKTCGAVMQDGFIFADTVANNIALGDDKIDWHKLQYSVDLANIREYVESLPQGFRTVIGSEGTRLSQGQRQRLLVARAVYRNPEYVFFDEATNSLDAQNESVILKNLRGFFKGRTVVIVAHRLSTVVGADQIVVLDRGKIVEIGNHDELTRNRGIYYGLVKNQLELGV